MRNALVTLAVLVAATTSCHDVNAPNPGRCFKVTFGAGAPDSVQPRKLLRLTNVDPDYIDCFGDCGIFYTRPSPNTPTPDDWMLQGLWVFGRADSLYMVTGEDIFDGPNQIRYILGAVTIAEEQGPDYVGTARYISASDILAWTSPVVFHGRSCAD